MDFGLATLEEVKSTKALPKPFTLANDNNHWVPMWLKSQGEKMESRPWLPLASYDTYLDKFGPAAEAAGAVVDCTNRAAGDCAYHSLLILQTVAASAPKVRGPREGEDPVSWTLEERKVWNMVSPARVKWAKFGRGEPGWWACKRTGAKIGKAKTAQEACQLFLERQALEPGI